MSDVRCGSTETRTGNPCEFPSSRHCPHHGVPKVSDNGESDDRPATKWDARVYAAYRRMLGDTQAEVGDEVGVTPRTIRNWENDETWPIACQQARSRWMRDIEREARSALYLQLRKARDPVRAMQVLERIDPGFAPPKHQVEHSGPGGGPIRTESEIDLSRLSTDDLRLLKQLRERATVTGNGVGA